MHPTHYIIFHKSKQQILKLSKDGLILPIANFIHGEIVARRG